MPLYLALQIFAAALVLAAIAAVADPRLRPRLLDPLAGLRLFARACVLSGASALVSSTRHAGTGFTTSHGWPKPFYFRYLDELGRHSEGWSLLYFLGNSLVFAAPLLIAWIVFVLVRR